MIYLDYSATTPVNKEVLDTYIKCTEKYIGNPNSLHKLGVESNKIINEATLQIKKVLNVDKDIIYTSGATEANNLAIQGICKKYQNRGNHIITTHLEHSSVINTVKALEKEGFKVSYVPIDKEGRIDLIELEKLITEQTILVSICGVNSEIGLEQDLNEISKIIKKHKKVIFHSDITQLIGKKEVDLNSIDLLSISSQKIYGPKSIGCLLKNKNIELEPIIYGGKSTTIYRSGTPDAPFIASFSKAIRLIYQNIDDKYKHVLKLNNYLRQELNKIDNIEINSTNISIPHILNFSINNIKPETLLHALEEEEIYISTKTACSNSDYSESVYELTNDKIKASHSLRISISYLTTKEEIEIFIKKLKSKITYLQSIIK